MNTEITLKTLELVITESEHKQRLDAALTSLIKAQGEDISRAYLQTLIKEQNLTHNDKPFTQSSHKAKEGETFTLTIPTPIQMSLEPENIPLDIIYEDEHLIVINKPAGMAVHPAVGNFSGTLVHALLHHCNDLSGINGVERPGIVHRLDKETTGLIVCAKSDTAHRHLAEQFANKTAGRTYQALCYGTLPTRTGTIIGNIGRDPKNRQKMTIVKEPNGKHAVTHYKTLHTYYSSLSLVECKLETGRTHQIRVHLTAKGHPIVGDAIYGRQRTLKQLPEETITLIKALPHQLLHAAELTFIHPITKEEHTFSAPLPQTFQDILDSL